MQSLRHHSEQGGGGVLQARLAEEAQHRLSAEKTALIGTIRKLNRDVAKLEVTGQAAASGLALSLLRGLHAVMCSCRWGPQHCGRPAWAWGEVQPLGCHRTSAILCCSCWACFSCWHAVHLDWVAAYSCWTLLGF